jgi:pectin methylesterase-like acyl-CoA thioesterase
MLVIFVIGELVPYPQADNNRHGHAYRQTGYINKRVDFVFGKVAEGDLEIIFKHIGSIGT